MPEYCALNIFEIAPTKRPCPTAYTGPKMCDHSGLKADAIAAMNPTIAPTMAIIGKLSTPGCGSATAIHPTAAEISNTANNTRLALAVPLTVMTPPWYLVVGPSLMGVPVGGAHAPVGCELAEAQPGSPA